MKRLDEVFALMDLFAQKDVDSLVIGKGDFHLSLNQEAKGTQAPPPAQEESPDGLQAFQDPLELMSQEDRDQLAPKPTEPGLKEVSSPAVGFYHPAHLYARGAGSDGEPIRVGSRISRDQVLCYLAVLDESVQVKSPVDGIVRQISFQESDFVQYNDLLFVIERLDD